MLQLRLVLLLLIQLGALAQAELKQEQLLVLLQQDAQEETQSYLNLVQVALQCQMYYL